MFLIGLFIFQNSHAFWKTETGPVFYLIWGHLVDFFSPSWFWFPVFALLGKWEGFPRNANCVRHLPLPPPYRSDQYHGLCQSFCCYSTTVALPSFQSMPLFFLFFLLLNIYLHLNLFFLEPLVEVALMSVVGRAADNLKYRQLIFSCYNSSFFFLFVSFFPFFQGWKRDVKDMVL